MQIIVTTKPKKCVDCSFFQDAIYGIKTTSGYISKSSLFYYEELPIVTGVGIRQRIECVALGVEISKDLAISAVHKNCPLIGMMQALKMYNEVVNDKEVDSDA